MTATPKFIQLGNQAYADTYEKMRSLVQADSFDDEIWLLEHDAVFTLGTAADPSHVLNPGNIPIVQTDRGGEVTFHGPGQLVIYLLLDIKTKKIGPKALVANLQNLIQNILQHYSIESSFVEGAPGVYVGEKKIASIGLRISKGRTYHGISLNVDMDLEPFSRINPCGYEGLEVTQISHFDSNVTMEGVESVATEELKKLFK
ncbi:lipoyl(octanoyl) transferase LipB [Gammaproteobacteria bacterium]|nr:lipoyl(octanoyl) transferase LipB [Gammaproteobacteria bacterium]MDB9837851.1 lipoyl(octanoyl) transferase LipB [Gammaproteobacteria bacterium]MDB9854839.1 lipoyl(octanoyl) transferase LipB [Gammaproteobacteria bacterium]MDB9946822.1 lipoyl(octanoyl) transferase LipB [Gammaproteobacteria bacterium]